MKLCNKLPNLRKVNNMSQEQLADKLDMSRQAISKWESGSSYPDMATIMKLCKILNCDISELIDDDAIGEKQKTPKEYKINLNDLFREVLDFITKSYNMFVSMSMKQKFAFLFEMGILALFLFAAFAIIGSIVFSLLFDQLLYIIPSNSVTYFFQSILSLAYTLISIVFGMIIFIHLYKLRYLDYYVTISDEEVKEKKIEKPLFDKDNKKVIIRDPKHSSYRFLNLMAKGMFIGFQIIMSFIALPFVMFFIFLAFLALLSIVYIQYGPIFVGALIGVLGALCVNYFFLEFMYNIIFKQVFKFKKLFIIFMTGLVLMGTGAGVSFIAVTQFKEIKLSSKLIKENIVEIDINDKSTYRFHEDMEIVINNDINNMKVTITDADFVKYHSYTSNSDGYEEIDIWGSEDPIKMYNMFLECLKRKNYIYESYDLGAVKKVEISQANYDKILENNKQHYGDYLGE